MRVIHGHAPLHGVDELVSRQQNVREHDGVTHRPVLVIKRTALNETALDDAVVERVERDSAMRLSETPADTPFAAAFERADVTAKVSVKPFGMDWIQRVLLTLEPI